MARKIEWFIVKILNVGKNILKVSKYKTALNISKYCTAQCDFSFKYVSNPIRIFSSHLLTPNSSECWSHRGKIFGNYHLWKLDPF